MPSTCVDEKAGFHWNGRPSKDFVCLKSHGLSNYGLYECEVKNVKSDIKSYYTGNFYRTK